MNATGLILLAVAALEPTRFLTCAVDGSDDHFILYPEHQIYQSDEHQVFSLMSARTLAVVNRQTLRFNRFTNLNLQPQPDRLQIFSGQCRRGPARH